MSLRAELQAIYDQHKALNPKLVVDAARPEDHPLHNQFEWDNEAAAEQYRLSQAADLIRSIRVVYKENPETGETSRVRAFVSTGESPSNYMPTAEALVDPLVSKLVLRMFERAILALKRQYGHLTEFESMLRQHALGGHGGQDAA